jgi:predicted MFS family arabinose efflux permease
VLFVAGLVGVGITDLVPQAMQTPWVLVSNAVAWMGGALYSVGRPPYLVSALPAERRVELFALERVLGIGLGAVGCLAVGVVPEIVAAVLGTSLDDPAPYRLTLLLAPIVLGAALVWFAAAPRSAPAGDEVEDEAVGRGRPPGAASPMRVIVLASLCALLLNMAFAPPQYLFNVYLEHGLAAPAPLIALVMSAARLASAPATVFLPAAGARWSIGGLLVAIAVATGLALVPMGLFPDVVVASLGFLVIALLLGLFEPAFDVFRMEAVPNDWRTRMAGISLAAMYGGQSAGGFAGGLIADRFGYRAMFIAASVLAAVAACLFAATLQAMRHPDSTERLRRNDRQNFR